MKRLNNNCLRMAKVFAGFRYPYNHTLKTAQHLGNLRQVKYFLAVLDGQSFVQVAGVLCGHEKTIATWVGIFCGYGLKGAPRQKATGHPPKLTPTHKAALATRIDEGSVKAGLSGACWRSPMIQQMMYDCFGVFYKVFYIAQLLKNLGFSFQKAACVSDHTLHQSPLLLGNYAVCGVQDKLPAAGLALMVLLPLMSMAIFLKLLGCTLGTRVSYVHGFLLTSLVLVGDSAHQYHELKRRALPV